MPRLGLKPCKQKITNDDLRPVIITILDSISKSGYQTAHKITIPNSILLQTGYNLKSQDRIFQAKINAEL